MAPRTYGAGRSRDLVQLAAAVVGSAAAAQVVAGSCCSDHDEVESIQCCDECPHEAEQAAQAQEHTYDAAVTDPGMTVAGDGYAWVVGANERRLIIKRMGEGVYLGGCLISDPGTMRELAAYLNAEAEQAARTEVAW